MKSYLLLVCIALMVSCQETNSQQNESNNDSNKTYDDLSLSQEFKDYWYNGTAEISSYELSQARYGEMRSGHAVMVFVTEPFDKNDQVKADSKNADNRPVLKLNATRDFNTGIYPYKIMSSTFLPLDKKEPAIKIATSIQEWCGHTYMQLNSTASQHEVTLHSYFQSEGNINTQIDRAFTENGIALRLRNDPKNMPTGEIMMLPSTEFLRLKHIETKPYKAIAKLEQKNGGYVYSVKYPDLNRTIAFKTNDSFPYEITAWMDRYMDGGAPMVSTGTLKKTIRSAYWNKNANKHKVLRDSLGI